MRTIRLFLLQLEPTMLTCLLCVIQLKMWRKVEPGEAEANTVFNGADERIHWACLWLSGSSIKPWYSPRDCGGWEDGSCAPVWGFSVLLWEKSVLCSPRWAASTGAASVWCRHPDTGKSTDPYPSSLKSFSVLNSHWAVCSTSAKHESLLMTEKTEAVTVCSWGDVNLPWPEGYVYCSSQALFKKKIYIYIKAIKSQKSVSLWWN